MQTVLLKISGELFSNSQQGCMNVAVVQQLIQQIKQLTQTHHISMVIGGGNFFRGGKEGKALGLTAPTADAIGMLATVMNALMLRDMLVAAGVPAMAMSAYPISGIVPPVDQAVIEQAKAHKSVIIFAGGTGNPFFTTDTAAVLRALQVGASAVWKATKVPYVYDADPVKHPEAKPLKKLSYTTAIANKLEVMDLAALALAQQHNLTIRVFDLFATDALHNVANNPDFGSTIVNQKE